MKTNKIMSAKKKGASVSIAYLVERADARLEDHVGVEEEGAQEWLRVAGQLGDDANQQQVDMQRVLQHILQLRQDHTDEWTCREDTVSGLAGDVGQVLKPQNHRGHSHKPPTQKTPICFSL